MDSDVIAGSNLEPHTSMLPITKGLKLWSNASGFKKIRA